MEQHRVAPIPEAIRLLSDETRWRLVGELRWSDRQVGELSERLQLPQNLVSYHLGLLRQAGLVQSHRSDADGRALYYGLDMSGVRGAYAQIGAALQLGTLADAILPTTVLFVCTRNSARSQIAEGWLRALSGGRVIARSAGTEPAELHPLAIRAMAEVGIDIGHQRAKSLQSLSGFVPDLEVTVCDLAREQCADGLTASARIHWSIPDPVAARGPESERLDAFRTTRDQLRLRVESLLGLLPGLQQPGSV